MSRNRKEFLVWVGVVGLYAAATLPNLLRYPPVWPDEVLFMSPADSLAKGNGMGTEVLAGFIPGIERYTFWLPPGYFLALASVFRLLEPSHPLLAMRLFSWLLGVVLLGMCWAVLRRLNATSWLAWLSLALLATHITIIRASNVGRMETLTLACGTAGVAAYLRFRQGGQARWLAGAGFLCGLGCLCHPAGVIVTAALLLHLTLCVGVQTLIRREPYIFLGAASIALLPWLIYALRSPELFLTQFGMQFARKASGVENTFARGNPLAWVVRPLLFGDWPAQSHFPGAVSALMFLTSLVMLSLARSKAEGLLLALWLVLGFMLNLFTLEQWYPIYFVVPMILAVGYAAATTDRQWGRVLGTATLGVGLVWNLVQVAVIFKSPDGNWADYKRYASSIAAGIPPGSTILLKAIPDPYFGLRAENRAYRFYEFVPEGLPVERALADQSMALVDYVVDSGCCNPDYLKDHLAARGTVVGRLTPPDRGSPPVRIWKLRSP